MGIQDDPQVLFFQSSTVVIHEIDFLTTPDGLYVSII
jgi:hypothetical protein